jgi:hypothetical protein
MPFNLSPWTLILPRGAFALASASLGENIDMCIFWHLGMCGDNHRDCGCIVAVVSPHVSNIRSKAGFSWISAKESVVSVMKVYEYQLYKAQVFG